MCVSPGPRAVEKNTVLGYGTRAPPGPGVISAGRPGRAAAQGYVCMCMRLSAQVAQRQLRV